MEGQDVKGHAETGSDRPWNYQCIRSSCAICYIVEPTRELCGQVLTNRVANSHLILECLLPSLWRVQHAREAPDNVVQLLLFPNCKVKQNILSVSKEDKKAKLLDILKQNRRKQPSQRHSSYSRVCANQAQLLFMGIELRDFVGEGATDFRNAEAPILVTTDVVLVESISKIWNM
uniref:Uncharacterized protein n=1 Tax=Ditylenchus dipsaci TaxID=166011 RepID=A0A915DE11_9BILA